MTLTVRVATAERRVALLVAAGVTAVAGLGYVGLADPHDSTVPMPVCPWHAVTGLSCPGCGGLRMTHDLLHGQLAAAWADNAVLLLLAPVLLVLLARAAVRFATGRAVSPRGRLELRGPLGWSLVAIGLSWAVVRNLACW